MILHAWHLLGAIYLEHPISDPPIQVIWEINTQTNKLWWSNWSIPCTLKQPLTRVASPFNLTRLTCLCGGIPFRINFGKYRRNWSKHKINEKTVIRIWRVLRSVKRILLLACIQWIMIQVFEANGLSLFRSVGSLVSRLNKQTLNVLVLPLPPHHISFKISLKPLTIFAKIPILYTWLGSGFVSDACVSNVSQ